MLRKLAGTVAFLSADADPTRSNSKEQFETGMIESMLERMASIFAIQPHGKSANKAENMLTGHKKTEILTDGRVVSIEVVERVSRPEPKLLDPDNLPTRADAGVDPAHDDALNPADHEELSCMLNILTTSAVAPYFKMFMTSNLLLENLMFWDEAEKYRESVCQQADRLYMNFIAEQSINQINIASSLRQRVDEGMEDPASCTFDEAQAECFKLMETNAYRQFLSSKFCKAYLHSKLQRRSKPQSATTETSTRQSFSVQGQTQGKQSMASKRLDSIRKERAARWGSNSAPSPVRVGARLPLHGNSDVQIPALSLGEGRSEDAQSDQKSDEIPLPGVLPLQSGGESITATDSASAASGPSHPHPTAPTAFTLLAAAATPDILSPTSRAGKEIAESQSVLATDHKLQ